MRVHRCYYYRFTQITHSQFSVALVNKMRFILPCLPFISEADNRKWATFQTWFMSYEDFCYVNLQRKILYQKYRSGIN